MKKLIVILSLIATPSFATDLSTRYQICLHHPGNGGVRNPSKWEPGFEICDSIEKDYLDTQAAKDQAKQKDLDILNQP